MAILQELCAFYLEVNLQLSLMSLVALYKPFELTESAQWKLHKCMMVNIFLRDVNMEQMSLNDEELCLGHSNRVTLSSI